MTEQPKVFEELCRLRKENEQLQAEIKQQNRDWLITNNKITGCPPEPYMYWEEFFADMIDKRTIAGLRISSIKKARRKGQGEKGKLLGWKTDFDSAIKETALAALRQEQPR